MLFILSGFIMFVSHRYFSLEKPVRKVVRHRHLRTTPLSDVVGPYAHYGTADLDAAPAKLSDPSDDESEEKPGNVVQAGEDDEDDEGDGGGGFGGGGGGGGGEDDEEEKEGEEEEESEGETPAGNDADSEEPSVAGDGAAGSSSSSSSSVTSTASTAASDSHAALVASAKTALLAYPEPSDEFKCTPNAKARSQAPTAISHRAISHQHLRLPLSSPTSICHLTLTLASLCAVLTIHPLLPLVMWPCRRGRRASWTTSRLRGRRHGPPTVRVVRTYAKSSPRLQSTGRS